ncbi:Predicted ATP-dependent endonuclease of the OLD family, contains P-loop ATPase and TOPRIM domains [Maribacter dokdonensis]|uniref:Predicted ATP-dependent endonuclease of the OLD family, contains P-loop ATPase and TOPRIM domains n=1 Tax=Maribacter dokdonensis TaxID=320912 RepID=A0ABY0U0X3_9FLAO|nr:AAA family ATPase [Maribacter dokdonensis]SDR88111.1 Predicted ATP-dependent endonuclease of the OLD family, contains P-loop ATPase and TOPRIM domains [Maribacter dokdonensis]
MIKSIQIDNFRSIQSLFIKPRNLYAFLGPNSTGKTNVLKAIDLVLGEGWTTKAKVARELFNDPTNSINIEIEFTNPVMVPNNGYADTAVSSIRLEMNLYPDLTAKTTINGGATFYGHEKFKKLCHFIYIPSERNLTSELRVSQWTMLGKMMRLIYENYVLHYGNNEENLKEDFKNQMNPAKEFLENDFSETQITFKKFTDKFKEKCAENSSGLATGFHPVLDIYNINWFYKTLQIHVSEDNSQLHFDSNEVGAGMQNLLMISIFQTYSELMGGKVIFGIEEPEIYLYPQAQRSLYKSFQKLSEHTQILYTTHNPNFVNAQRAYELEMLQKNEADGTYNFEKLDFINEIEAEKQKFKIYSHFNTERNEIFFAKKILFVEGASDKIFYTTIFEEKWNIDIDKIGLSIIDCNGKGGIIYFGGLCSALGMNNYFAIWDSDDEAIDKYKVLSNLSEQNKGLELVPNLETFLNSKIEGANLNPNSKDKIKPAYELAISIDVAHLPEEFNLIKQFTSE